VKVLKVSKVLKVLKVSRRRMVIRVYQ